MPQIHGSLRPTFGALRVIGVFGGQQLVSVHLGFSFVFIISYSSGWIIIIPEGHPIAHVNIDSTCSHTLEWNLKKLIEAELNHELGSDRGDWRDSRSISCAGNALLLSDTN